MELIRRRRADGERPAGEAGFTLVEMVISVTVVLLMAGAALLAVPGIVESANKSSCEAQAGSINNAIVASYASNGGYANATPAGLVSDEYLVAFPEDGFELSDAAADQVTVTVTGRCLDQVSVWGGVNEYVYSGGSGAEPAPGPQDQTITFNTEAPSNAKLGQGPPYFPSAIASSGLSVTFSIDVSSSALCEINNGEIVLLAAGFCTINADQAGNADYNPAPQVQQTFTIDRGDQEITVLSDAPDNASVNGPDYVLDAEASSGLPVTVSIDGGSVGVCEYSGGNISFVGEGTCTIRMNQPGNANYLAAPEKLQSFAVGPELGCGDGGLCQVGDTGPGGGVIFYDAGPAHVGDRYYEVAPSGADFNGMWCDAGGTAATSTAIGTGKANTAAILGLGCTFGAVVNAVAYNGGGKNDWYVPSADEMLELCKYARGIAPEGNCVALNNPLSPSLGLDDMTQYWTSSQFDGSNVYISVGLDGITQDSPQSMDPVVRPIRSFN